MKVRILLADDHQILRQGLRSLLDKEDDMQVIAEADDGRAAVKLFSKLKPNVVIMDVGMPGLNGIEATRQIVKDNPNAKVIALSMHTDESFVGRMLEAGASGYLLKECVFDELAGAVRSVAANRVYLSPAIAGVVVDSYRRNRPSAAPAGLEDLTDREREVLQLIAEGKSTKEIALQLKVSSKTVETHRRNIREKVDVHSVAELTKYAIRQGLTSLEK